MTTDYVEEVLRSLDPASIESAKANLTHEDEIWQSIVRSLEEAKPSRVRRYEIVGAVGAVVTASAVLIAVLGGAPTSALAATLHDAALADSHAAALPPLAAGQYYYQDSQVSLTCEVASPSMPAGEAPITYISDGTMESWTTADGAGKVVLTPSVINGNGSHFATPDDEARWVAAGEPFIPCALMGSSNELNGNPANVDNGGSLGGYSSTVSGYGGFGLSLAMTSETDLLSSATSINNLPSSATDISSLLADGQINPDGSVSASPQACPIIDGSDSTSIGCTPNEQLDVMEQLIQLPDASAKLGSTLYQVLADLPGATLLGPVVTPNGSAGTAVSVPQSNDEAFEVVLDPTTGALVSCSELLTQNGTTTSIASVSYGSVQVVDGSGTTPVSTRNS